MRRGAARVFRRAGCRKEPFGWLAAETVGPSARAHAHPATRMQFGRERSDSPVSAPSEPKGIFRPAVGRRRNISAKKIFCVIFFEFGLKKIIFKKKTHKSNS